MRNEDQAERARRVEPERWECGATKHLTEHGVIMCEGSHRHDGDHAAGTLVGDVKVVYTWEAGPVCDVELVMIHGDTERCNLAPGHGGDHVSTWFFPGYTSRVVWPNETRKVVDR